MTIPTLLDITESSTPREVHRIIPLNRLLELLGDRKNALVYPPVWNDPYEAVRLRTTIAYPAFRDSADGVMKFGRPFKGEPIRAGMIEHGSPADYEYYCQSWSAAEESETMWRAYSPGCDAVRISVNVQHLLDQAVKGLHDHAVYFGKVNYFPREEIERLAGEGQDNRRLQWCRVREGPPWGISWARSLMKKRDAFRHEEEFRLVAIRGQALISKKVKDNFLLHEIDPALLLTRVLIDPRCTDSAGHEEKIRLAGFSGLVQKSTILDPPNLQVWNSHHPREWKR